LLADVREQPARAVPALLQLPLSRLVPRAGYKRMMQFGWGLRTLALTPLIAMPLLDGVIGHAWTVVVVIAMYACFVALRACGVVAWLPWLSTLIPADARGAFLSRDRQFMNIASLAGLSLSALLLATGSARGYSIVFLIGMIAAYGSLIALWRIPQPVSPPAPAAGRSFAQVLRAPFKNPQFRRWLVFGVLGQIFHLGTTAFTIVYARTRVGLSDSTLLWLTALASVGVLGGMAWVRSRLDRWGGKPFLWGTLGWWAFATLCWLALALTGSAWSIWIAPALLIISDGFAWMYELFAMRQTMNTIAEGSGGASDDATHFAVYAVIVNVSSGLASIGFGALLDGLQTLRLTVGALIVDNYGVLFATELLVIALAALALRRVANR
jgi:Na+/melibiose symporter-like transporter